MAGDWIKMEKDTPEKPEILALASILSRSVAEVFLACFKLWRWADSHTADGYAKSLTVDRVDELSAIPGFGVALSNVGWLQVRTGALQVPNFDRHMGQSAKKRALTANRMEKSRRNKSDADSVTKASPEKRREENNTPLPPKGGKRPKFDPTEAEIPEPLNTPLFREAWLSWCQYRAERKKALTFTSVERQLKQLADMGPNRACQLIERSITNGYTGVVFPEDKAAAKSAAETASNSEAELAATQRMFAEQDRIDAEIQAERDALAAERNGDDDAF